MMDPGTLQNIIEASPTIIIVGGGLIAQAAYIKGQIKALQGDVQEMKADTTHMKDHVRYTATCDALNDGLDRRIGALESIRNGKP